ncbi:MAG: cell division protein FtsX [Patescibacteria group bacterium]
MFLIISRTFKEGWKNFLRNGWLSVASVSILFFSLLIISLLFSITVTASDIIREVQNKINISIYFKTDVSEENIRKAQSELESFREVEKVEYITKEQALSEFKSANANEPTVLKALEEIGENPLLSYLVVKTQNPEQYEGVVAFSEQSAFKDDISRINYGKNKEKINEFNNFINQIRKVGVILGSIFALVAILITFNTIRLTIYSQRQEIEIMRLVGASNAFIRLPFIFEGIINGLIAMTASMGILLLVIKLVGMYILSGGEMAGKLVSFYFDGFWELLLIQFILAIFLGIVSSFIAMRRYLKV